MSDPADPCRETPRPVFEGVRAWAYARQLAFPRLAGRAGEQEAARFIEQTFTTFGYAVETHPFPIRAAPWGWIRAGLAGGIVLLMAAALAAPRAPLLAALCCALLFLLLPAMNALWRRHVTRRRPGDDARPASANLIARHPEASSGDLSVYLVAHYDSKSQSLSIRRRIVLVMLMLTGTAAFGLVHLAAGVHPAFAGAPAASWAFWSADLLWAMGIAAALWLLGMRTENRSPGGLDNAGSLGVLLALAEAFRTRPCRHLNLAFVATGAEELGLLGALDLARRFRERLDPDRVWILNLDGLGAPGALRCVEGARMFRAPHSRFARLLRQTAGRLSIPLRPMRLLPGFLLDHIPFSRQGFQATSLITVSGRSRHIHTPEDTIDRVDPEGLQEAGALITAVLNALP
jgi:hypothetical protein